MPAWIRSLTLSPRPRSPRVHVRGQAHLGVVRLIDHHVGVVERDHRRHRTEDLVSGDRRIGATLPSTVGS